MKLEFFAQLGRWLILVPIFHAAADTTVAVDGDYLNYYNSTYLEKRAETFYLRILPLGASIVTGWGSSSGNG